MSPPIYVEILTPRLDEQELDRALETFAERYQAVLKLGYVASVPDNPMGVPRFQLVEVLNELRLPVAPDRVLMHLNAFHTPNELDRVLEAAISLGIRQLLVVSGDGGPRLPRLKPEAIGANAPAVTSVELLHYIAHRHPGSFSFAVAFNPYEPRLHEMQKMRRKLDAGAGLCITQPILDDNNRIEELARVGIPLALGAWMSRRLHLLSDCVGYEIADDVSYDPVANLRRLRRRYPHHGLYLALLNFKTQLSILPQVLG